ncbi:MAG TPA: haloacid dehalogenase type II [Candidatus Acidoferrales bacterium]|nr:haloacid dehalogenase type II [Candidatus Acidoferrales bacterium]
MDYPFLMDVTGIRLITFDCYGTLIDWETGMLSTLRQLFSQTRPAIPDAKLLELYGEAEAEIEAGPYQRYRNVLSETVQAMGSRLGVQVTPGEEEQFANSLKHWEPFPDTVAALKTLGSRFKLGIISNVDDDLFAASQKKLDVKFDVVVTAEQVQSYKPALKNFQEVLRRSGLKEEQVLHAGQSVYHDIIPTNSLGIRNVWVNRPSLRPGSGAAKPASAQPSLEVQSLAELATVLTAGTQAAAKRS